MARTSSGNYDALAWVQEEVQKSLADALHALTSYIDEPTDTAVLGTCVTQLHQVSGTVEMLNLGGAHLLASELLASTITLREQQGDEQTVIQDGLLKGMFLLQNYLQLISLELKDHPLRIITTVNELRIARGDEELSLNSVFKPLLSITLPEFIAPSSSSPKPIIKISLKKVNHIFQISFLEWFKNDDQLALQRMADILHYLRLCSIQERSVILWWTAEGIIEALLDGGLTVTSEVRLKIAQLNKSISIFTNENEQHLQVVFPTALVQELLLLIAQATSSGKHIFLLKNIFALDFFDAQQHQKIYSLSNSALTEAHSELLRQLQEIKEYVDQFDRHSENSLDAIKQLPEQLESMANTFTLLADNASNTLLQQQADNFSRLIEQQQLPEDDLLMSLANDLITIEAQLQKNSHITSELSTDSKQLQNTVILECQNDLMSVKEALSILSNQADNSSDILTNSASQLQQISDTLLMINLNQLASLFENTAKQMTQIVNDEKEISNQELNWFAEIIAFADLYMDILRQGGNSKQTQLLIDGQSTLLNFNQSSPLNLSTLQLEEDKDLSPNKTETSVERYINKLITLNVQSESSVQQYINAQSEGASTPIVSPSETAIITNEIDPEIAEIFLEEAHEVLNELQELTPSWELEHDLDTLKTIRRHFHTLKGSGRMAGAELIGELSWSVENLLNRVIDQIIPLSSEIDSLIPEACQAIHLLLPDFINGNNSTSKDIDSLISTLNSLAEKKEETISETSVQRYINQQLDIKPATSVEQYINKLSETETETETETEIILSDDDELHQIFLHEAIQHINTFKKEFETSSHPFTLNKELLRAAHSLKGCANIAQVMPVAAVATQLDKTLKVIYENNLSLDQKDLSLLSETIDNLDLFIAHLQTPLSDEPDILPLLDNLIQITPDDKKHTSDGQEKLIDPEFLVVYLEETDELLSQYTNELELRQQQPDDAKYQDALHKTLSLLIENAQHAQRPVLAELYQLLAQLTQQHEIKDKELVSLLNRGYEEINNQIENLIQNKPPTDIVTFKQLVEKLLARLAEEQRIRERATEWFTVPTDDPELLDAFTEECLELLASSDTAIHNWQENHNNTDASLQLQRVLHTIKGSARLTNIRPIADLTHHTESLVFLIADKKQDPNERFFTLLQRSQDRLSEMQELLAQKENIPFAHDLIAEIAAFTGQVAPKLAIAQTSNENEHHEESAQNNNATALGGEQIRIRADLLDFLTNFTGEVNISRDRVGQQNSAIQQQLVEMESTVSRLQDQLRNLEIETETQILFRFEDEVQDHKSDFDPLELDRFSMIQQLSRSLTESVSDMNEITQSIDNIVRDSDAILLQQSRLSADLEQGLMNTRLLPFTGLVPRFERIIRQVNTELGKQATLTVHGADRELDRTILDRIVAPLEHIIRNAIAHGIETPEMRINQGKGEVGQLTLSISREGSEILMSLSDDGQGIDIEKVRQKALEQKLINPEHMPSNEELIQLILTSGFSTADNISQLAGRGVGMDVVSNEIRALKGRLSIHSVEGEGTTFNIRLPLTLSIMQSLMVSSHDEQFAIPLTSVHAGARITVAEINTLLNQEGEAQFEFNGEYYRFIPLANLLEKPLSLPDEPKLQLPVLLFRYGDMSIALLVDSINSNREIVLKSMGDQLSHISSITGATILGDGQVVFILDIPALVNSTDLSVSNEGLIDAIPDPSSQALDRTPIAMVVDDSITMRKVSGNLLRRHGFEVITAKDGIDAVAQLNDHLPDIILLDVEMPRMDGFEFATLVRNVEQYSKLPIIMITSRTGEKHRERARSIGVNAYLGKPYQELELVETMQNLLGSLYPNAKQ